MTDGTTEDIDVAGLVAIVDGRRSEGLSVAAACRAAGVSTSTYYRRRRLANPVTTVLEEAEAAGAAALVSQKVAPDWKQLAIYLPLIQSPDDRAKLVNN